MDSNEQNRNLLEDLGHGLILRRSTPADAEALADFVARVFARPESGEPDVRLGAWARELLAGGHPTFRPDDFTLVEEAAGGRIVSSLNLISQRWSYGGIEFEVGRPELVATLPEFRRRGLVRRQMDVVHRWSAERGHLVQAITGIPWFYRQFGYEMAITLGGTHWGDGQHLPQLPEGEEEPFRLRPAAEADLPIIARVYEQGQARYRVACVRDAAMWRRELAAAPDSDARRELRVIETPAGQPVGLLVHPPILWGPGLAAILYELGAGVSWLAATPSVLRYLWATAQELGARQAQPVERVAFSLGPEHPAYIAAGDRLPRVRPPYAWYVRVPDLARFVRHVAPALERSLASSPAAGYGGELRLNFYRGGLRLVLDAGRLVEAEAWNPPDWSVGEAAFPGLTFLQLLFGYRSLEELRHAFADCRVDDSTPAAVVLAGLFPKQASDIWPVG